MFNKILIANRGEIACRIIKTAKKLGISTVAIYSAADANALHVSQADTAYYVGGAKAQDSYLKIDTIIDIAKKTNCDAVHPGYGFLSENADFAAALAKESITFIGPPIAAIKAMGSKSAAKQIMQKAKVPLVTGFHGDKQDAAFLKKEASKIGYPIMLKAAAGGGGKGMRMVANDKEFDAALTSAKREAKASFNDDKMLLEKYLTKPRHIEIQVFADTQGNYVHLFERDCSIQRRHQKVLEEAPAPNMTEDLRTKMGKVAINAAKAIDYVGAGTVEFLLDEDGSFYFMEMNTRLQVEHPVTEMISGQDLVEWQLLVASGQTLPCKQNELIIQGHAIEARIYAEDPNNDFLPSTGTLNHLITPKESKHVRIDSGIVAKDEVSPYYDPMLAKLIVWDKERKSALRRLNKALNQYQISGVKTNINFLSSLINTDNYIKANLDTGFINKNRDLIFTTSVKIPNRIYFLASLYLLLQQKQTKSSVQNQDPYSPWFVVDGWRMNLSSKQSFYYLVDENPICVNVHYSNEFYQFELDGEKLLINGTLTSEDQLIANIQQAARIKLNIIADGELLLLNDGQNNYQIKKYNPTSVYDQEDEASGGLTAPMPGTIVAVLTEIGKSVNAGDNLLVLEAMKMEHTIQAPTDGIVKDIFYQTGDLVDEGSELLMLET